MSPEVGVGQHLRRGLGDGRAALDQDLAGLGVDDVAAGDPPLELGRPPWGRRCRPSRSRRRPGGWPRRRRTAGLMARSRVIDENLPDWSIRTPRVSFLVTCSSIQLPRSGMIRQACSLRSPASISTTKSTPGAAVELADDHALGAVDDELAAADHDRHVAQVDRLLDGRLALVQAEPDVQAGGRRSGGAGGTRRARSAACPGRT